MTTPNEFLVIKTQNWVVGIQEFRMENNLDPISRPVEEFNSSDLVQNGIIGVIGHIVRGDGWERVSLEGKDSSFQEYLVFLGEEVFGFRDFSSVFTACQLCYTTR